MDTLFLGPWQGLVNALGEKNYLRYMFHLGPEIRAVFKTTNQPRKELQ